MNPVAWKALVQRVAGFYTRAQHGEGGCLFFAADDRKVFDTLVYQHGLHGKGLIRLMTEAQKLAKVQDEPDEESLVFALYRDGKHVGGIYHQSDGTYLVDLIAESGQHMSDVLSPEQFKAEFGDRQCAHCQHEKGGQS